MEAATGEGPRLLGIPELASYLGIPVATLYVWRAHGEGPRGIRVGRYVRFRPEDVEDWLEQRTDRARAKGDSSARGELDARFLRALALVSRKEAA